ncbi:hypothetical protein ROZALSC1DRAFT_25002 [Rozella allomycis CSF55]|uniref:Uncharacterized protein n=1 Tax=Rozella allomycis (strain CSF55) TaxID=988480 RepID=A0A4P9YBN9_ROZAC|nr:hypothetical protein ROZALSC1DRAFT_25002 [Rozella allomycis CSF55]
MKFETPKPLAKYGKAAFHAHKLKILDFFGAEGLRYLLRDDFKPPEVPVLLDVPAAPVPPKANDKDYANKLQVYQKSCQIYGHVKSMNNEAQEKYEKYLKDQERAFSLLKYCFRETENNMVFLRDNAPKGLFQAALLRLRFLILKLDDQIKAKKEISEEQSRITWTTDLVKLLLELRYEDENIESKFRLAKNHFGTNQAYNTLSLAFFDKTQRKIHAGPKILQDKLSKLQMEYREKNNDVNHTGNMVDPCLPAYWEKLNSYYQSRPGVGGNILADSAAGITAPKTENCETEADFELMSTPRKRKKAGPEILADSFQSGLNSIAEAMIKQAEASKQNFDEEKFMDRVADKISERIESTLQKGNIQLCETLKQMFSKYNLYVS